MLLAVALQARKMWENMFVDINFCKFSQSYEGSDIIALLIQNRLYALMHILPVANYWEWRRRDDLVLLSGCWLLFGEIWCCWLVLLSGCWLLFVYSVIVWHPCVNSFCGFSLLIVGARGSTKDSNFRGWKFDTTH